MDVDDIHREIDETSQADCAAEIERLKRKRRGYKASFTQILNIIDALLKASVQDNQINKSETNRLSIEKAFEKLEQRYEKLEKVNYRILSLNQDNEQATQEAIDANTTAYTQRIEIYGQFSG